MLFRLKTNILIPKFDPKTKNLNSPTRSDIVPFLVSSFTIVLLVYGLRAITSACT